MEGERPNGHWSAQDCALPSGNVSMRTKGIAYRHTTALFLRLRTKRVATGPQPAPPRRSEETSVVQCLQPTELGR